ncbi:hypothetical protein [Maritimibacter alkaliphilus]|uniref:hypothetical protein n=1 Tax=Maritimibacter alkaliphilus TaxID=404236 RepID=UPI0011E6CBE4|nr:hypothetical protein [Maritimibacter alkaliphilus]
MHSSYREDIASLASEEMFEFFATFARFEYAMKRAKFLEDSRTKKQKKDGDTAEVNARANWNTFATLVDKSLLSTVKKCSVCKVLIEDPAKRHRVTISGEKNFDTLQWQDADAPQSVNDLFLQVRRIRNSLFHGEKSVHSNRDAELVRAGLHFLDHVWEAIHDSDSFTEFVDAFDYL